MKNKYYLVSYEVKHWCAHTLVAAPEEPSPSEWASVRREELVAAVSGSHPQGCGAPTFLLPHQC